MTASIAQKMLERHEELVSVLPPDIKALIPRLNDFAGLDMAVGTPGRRSRETTGSSAASHDLRSPLESDPALNPMLAFPSPNIPDHHFPGAQCHVHPGESYAEVQQQETDERLAAMEQALADARESEEAQRKVAARLRKDFEKLQRDYERAEAQAIKDNTGSNTVMTPRRKTPSRAGPVSCHPLCVEVVVLIPVTSCSKRRGRSGMGDVYLPRVSYRGWTIELAKSTKDETEPVYRETTTTDGGVL